MNALGPCPCLRCRIDRPEPPMLTWRRVGLIWAATLAAVAMVASEPRTPPVPFDANEPVYPFTDWPDDEHNDLGGYIPACGERAPLVGDDC